MTYEVELKFRVENYDVVEEHLKELGGQFHEPIDQTDCYFAHPSRDFASTDEALRIRSVGSRNFITYKGPKIDPTTKTRREIELPLADGKESVVQYGELLTALGFSRVAEVRKRRHPIQLIWENRQVEVALDAVEQVGNFVELEVAAEENELDAAKDCVISLASRLGLSENVRTSYLELLLVSIAARQH